VKKMLKDFCVSEARSGYQSMRDVAYDYYKKCMALQPVDIQAFLAL
jgi:hypothetical protein